MPFAVSLWHKGGFRARKGSIMGVSNITSSDLKCSTRSLSLDCFCRLSSELLLDFGWSGAADDRVAGQSYFFSCLLPSNQINGGEVWGLILQLGLNTTPVLAPVFSRVYPGNQSIGDLTFCFCLSANLSEKQVFLSSKPLYYLLIGNLRSAEI